MVFKPWVRYCLQLGAFSWKGQVMSIHGTSREAQVHQVNLQESSSNSLHLSSHSPIVASDRSVRLFRPAPNWLCRDALVLSRVLSPPFLQKPKGRSGWSPRSSLGAHCGPGPPRRAAGAAAARPGRFDPHGHRPPSGTSHWTQAEVRPRGL